MPGSILLSWYESDLKEAGGGRERGPTMGHSAVLEYGVRLAGVGACACVRLHGVVQ